MNSTNSIIKSSTSKNKINNNKKHKNTNMFTCKNKSMMMLLGAGLTLFAQPVLGLTLKAEQSVEEATYGGTIDIKVIGSGCRKMTYEITYNRPANDHHHDPLTHFLLEPLSQTRFLQKAKSYFKKKGLEIPEGLLSQVRYGVPPATRKKDGENVKKNMEAVFDFLFEQDRQAYFNEGRNPLVEGFMDAFCEVGPSWQARWTPSEETKEQLCDFGHGLRIGVCRLLVVGACAAWGSLFAFAVFASFLIPPVAVVLTVIVGVWAVYSGFKASRRIFPWH